MAQEERVDAGDRGRDEGVGGEGDGSSTPSTASALTPPEVTRPPRGGRSARRRTNPILVMTCAQHNINTLLKLRRILVVFRELTVVKRTQFLWRRSQFRRGVRRGVELGVRRRPEARPRTERERRDAWMEIARREWIRSRAEKEARERERIARLNAGVANGGASAAEAAGGVMGSQDVRGP